MKIKCNRRERLPLRCTRCETTDSKCQISSDFQRRRVKAHDDHETSKLRQELEKLKSQVASLIPQASPAGTTNAISPSSGSISTSVARARPEMDPTLQRSAGDIVLLPLQIDTAFAIFFKEMHPFLPFLVNSTPNSTYSREPFLFWTICLLGLRSGDPDLSKALSNHVSSEALQAPMRSCHNQAAATSVVQALLLLAIWPFNSPSQLHEHAWLHCGSATHLAIQVGLHQPYGASEFVPKCGRKDIPGLFLEFRRTWIACYVVNSIVSFIRGYQRTVHSDHNIMQFTLSSAAELSISPDLFKALLIFRRIEEGQDLGNPRSTWDGHIDPASREGAYRLLKARLWDTEQQISPLSSFMGLILSAAKLQPKIQVLQSTTPLPLQETTVLGAINTATRVIDLARLVQRDVKMVHLPASVDSLVLMAALLIFKILISRFACFIDVQNAQLQIAEACSYFRDGINDFDDIPRRVTPFLEALNQMVLDGHLPTGGFVIENTKYRNSQNILYEVRAPVPNSILFRMQVLRN